MLDILFCGALERPKWQMPEKGDSAKGLSANDRR